MRIPWPTVRLDRAGWLKLAGGSASVAVALALYTRFSIHGWLTRDETIYVYGGQRMAHGVAPYASILDPKGPITTMLCGLGAGIARLFGRSDIMVIRVEFLLIALLAVAALYLLVLELWHSVVAAVAAATVFSSFEGYARAALVGPDAKMPGILFLLVAMWLAARRQWFWAAFSASLAFLTWQPFFPYPLVVLIAALVWPAGRRLRTLAVAVAGAVIPLLVLVVYFAAAGALGKFFESAFLFPLRGVRREHETVRHRIHRIVVTVHHFYGFSGRLLWIGIVLLLLAALLSVVVARTEWRAALVSPLVLLVVVTFVFEAGYAASDFQSYPDVYPLLPYGAIGFGAAVALAVERLGRPQLRQAATAAVLATAVALTLASGIWFADSTANNSGLQNERASACAVKQALLPGTSLYSMGNPMPLVLLHRRNPDRYVYLGSGLDAWKVKHTKGGFAGWTAQVAASHPSVVVVDTWRGPYKGPMERWLRSQGYVQGYIGLWEVYVSRAAHAAMPVAGISLTQQRTSWPRTDADTKYRKTQCS
jgi:hypothetical protein